MLLISLGQEIVHELEQGTHHSGAPTSAPDWESGQPSARVSTLHRGGSQILEETFLGGRRFQF